MAARVLHALEEAVVDADVLDCPLLNSNPNSVFEKQIAQLVAVNQGGSSPRRVRQPVLHA